MYSEYVRSAMLREGKSESAIERELNILHEFEKVPALFQRWAGQYSSFNF